MRPPTARSATILEAISTMGVINIDIQVPVPPKKIKAVGSHKRKATAIKKPSFGGYNFDCYLNFIKKTLNQMDKHHEMKGFYLVMDNSPIHGKKDKIIEPRAYKCVYLLPYSH